MRVTVQPDGAVEVVLPRWAAARDAEAAVRELAPWIERRRAALQRARAEQARPEGTLPYLGEELTLRPEPGRSRVHRRGDVLLVPEERGLEAIERWYRRQARSEIAARLDVACGAVDRGYRGLTIRGQRTRWASCSANGAMSFNWRLLLAPPEVLDYVVWHEICHLDVLDHSARFWALLAERCPDYERHARWLRRYGTTLTL